MMFNVHYCIHVLLWLILCIILSTDPQKIRDACNWDTQCEEAVPFSVCTKGIKRCECIEGYFSDSNDTVCRPCKYNYGRDFHLYPTLEVDFHLL